MLILCSEFVVVLKDGRRILPGLNFTSIPGGTPLNLTYGFVEFFDDTNLLFLRDSFERMESSMSTLPVVMKVLSVSKL